MNEDNVFHSAHSVMYSVVYSSSPGLHLAVMDDLFHEMGEASRIFSNRIYLVQALIREASYKNRVSRLSRERQYFSLN